MLNSNVKFRLAAVSRPWVVMNELEGTEILKMMVSRTA